jgi:hypothetical protein
MGFNDNIQLPSTIKIAGVTYKIIRETMADQGNIMFSRGVIKLNDDLCQDKAEETLCHEIVEAINEANELELPHPKIQMIGSMFHQILKDNDMSIMFGEG